MGVTQLPTNMPDELTPICNMCGIALCWSITLDEYNDAIGFWDGWICKDCNNGKPLSLKQWKQNG